MGRKIIRLWVFLCLALIVSISLTGCEGLKGLGKFVEGIVKDIKNVLGKIDKVVKPLSNAIKSGNDAINSIKNIGKTDGKTTTGTNKTDGIAPPDKDIDEPGQTTGKTTVKTNPQNTSGLTEEKAVEAKAKEIKDKVANAVKNLDQKIADLQNLAKTKGISKETVAEIEYIILGLGSIKAFLPGLVSGDIKAKNELDRITEHLNSCQKTYESYVQKAKLLAQGIEKAGNVVTGTVETIKKWVNTLFTPPSTTTTTPTTPATGKAGLVAQIYEKFGIKALDGKNETLTTLKVTAGVWAEADLKTIFNILSILPKSFTSATPALNRNSVISGISDNSPAMGCFSPKTGQIYLADSGFKAAPLSFWGLAGTLVHEMTHTFQDKNSSLESAWGSQFWSGGKPKTKSVTDYANTSPKEDMAEAVAYYVTCGKLMKEKFKDRYDFIKNKVMGGKEYDTSAER